MTKRLLFLSCVLSLIFSQSDAQVYTYNFGSVVDSITSGVAVSPTFLASPPDGGNARARVGTGGGKIVTNTHPNIGSGSSLRIQAPTGGSVNKFSIYNISNASSTLGLKFTFSVGDSVNGSNPSLDNGTFHFVAGNGASFSDNNAYNGSHTFTALRLVLGATEPTVSMLVNGSFGALSGFSVPYGTEARVILYMNNNSTAVNYTDINNVARSLPGNSLDLFIYNPGTGTYSFAGNQNKGGTLASGSSVNAFMFYGSNSAGNEANLFIDDIVYTNNIVNNTLPLKLAFFDALPDNNSIRLFWKTELETGIAEYIVEHSTDGKNFSEIGKVKSLEVNGSSYTFTHAQVSSKNFYRLRIMNEDGSSEYSQVIVARIAGGGTKLKAWYNDDAIHVAQHENAVVKVYDLSGKRVLVSEMKNADYAISLATLAPGMYIAQVISGDDVAIVKFAK